MRIAYLLIIALISAVSPLPVNSEGLRSLRVVTTFPGLTYDVGNLVCGSDVVESLLPPGVDPHEYSLTPGDIEKLESADLIVSTGHTGFEINIEELWRAGVLKGVLVNILEIPGLTVVVNPSTGQPDYHMPTYYPLNYLLFVRNISQTLVALNPTEASCYMEKARNIAEKVADLFTTAPRLRGVAVGDLPYTVYVAKWLGLDLIGLLVKEEGLPTTPEEVSIFRSLMANGSVSYVLVTSYGSDNPTASHQLEDWARLYGVKIIELYSETYPNSMLDKYNFILEQMSNTSSSNPPSPTSTTISPSTALPWMGIVLIGVAAAIIVVLTVYQVVAKKWR